MRFQHIIEQTYFRKWLITEQGWQAVHKLVEARVLKQNAERPTEDLWGDPLPVMTIENGIATIPVHGVISRKIGQIEKTCGAVDVLDISADIKAAIDSNSVRLILLDVNSPGGTVGGVPELAQQIADAAQQKHVCAYANDLMASAAYWLSAGATEIVASPSSTVGSIGVFMPHVDMTARYEQAGLRVDLIKSGIHKGAGYPGTALTEEQRALLQADVDETHEEFRAFIRAHRSLAKDEAMEGQCFSGKGAAEAGLVTGLVSSIEELKARLVDTLNQIK